MVNQDVHVADDIQKRTLVALRQILERVHNRLDGVEMVMVDRAIQMVYPRVEKRIREASAENLKAELNHIHSLLDEVLGKPEIQNQEQNQIQNQKSTKKPMKQTLKKSNPKQPLKKQKLPQKAR